jgi:hypothetical protein
MTQNATVHVPVEHYFPPKSFAAFCEAFSNVHPEKEVLNKTTIHRLVTKFHGTGSVCLGRGHLATE